MSGYWLRGLCILGWCQVAFSAQAQETTTYSRPSAPVPDPVYVLNSTIIINGLLTDFPAQQIAKVAVYKYPGSATDPSVPPALRNLGVGVVDITAAKQIRGQSLARLGRQLGLRGPLTFALNGHPLAPPAVAALQLAPAAIGQIHVVLPTPEQPATRVDIWLASPPKPDPGKYPPGSIFLR